jgi:hypothetical protein
MPLACQAYVYPASTSAEQAVTCVVVAWNPTAAPIAITGGRLQIAELSDFDFDESPYYVPSANNVLPIGAGMPVVVAPSSYLVVGPLPVVVHGNAGSNSFQTVGPAGVLTAPQPSETRGSNTGNFFPQFTVLVGGTLEGSDGSSNAIGWAPLLVDVVAPPPLGYQGGFLHLSAPNNLVTYLAGVL